MAYNPIYYYDPDKNFVQGNNKEKLRLPPGPNNPVGSVFIALTKPSYGLHGTPDPSKINKARGFKDFPGAGKIGKRGDFGMVVE